MKAYFIISAVLIMIGCNSSTKDNSANGTTNDSTGSTNTIATDTSKTPSGVDNSSVISTDTSATNVQNSINKADSAGAQKRKK